MCGKWGAVLGASIHHPQTPDVTYLGSPKSAAVPDPLVLMELVLVQKRPEDDAQLFGCELCIFISHGGEL